MTLNTKSRTRSETIKWKILLVFVASLLCQNIFSQSITWQRTYHVYTNDFGYEILPAPDNCFYFAGSIDNIISSYCYVLKLNQLGDTIWSRKYTGGLYTAALSHDSCCVIVNISDPMQITKIDKLGNILWNRTLPTWFICHDIQRLFDNGFVLCGNSGQSAFAVRIDVDGNFVWNRSFSGGSVRGFYSAVESFQNGLVFAGYNQKPDTTKIYVVKLDYDGNVIWEKNYVASSNRSSASSICMINNYYLIGGNTDVNIYKTFLIKIDTTGNLVQTKIWTPYTTSKELFDDLAVINSNRIVISKRVDSSSTSFTYAKTQLIDTNFSLIKEQVYFPSYSYSIFSSILPLQNRDILFAGTFDYYTNWSGHRYDLYAVRTDSNLNTSPFPPIGITNNINFIPNEYLLHQNYPNPFNPKTKIVYQIPYSSFIEIILYDLNGKFIIKLESGIKSAGNYEIEFCESHLSSGIYFYVLKEGGIIRDAKKMLLLK